MAVTFASAGENVVLAARRTDKLKQVADEVASAGVSDLPVTTDVTDEQQVSTLFAAAVDRFDHVDILVNNAGIAIGGPTDELALVDWQAVIDVNVTGAFACAREALRVMKPRRDRGNRTVVHRHTAALQRHRQRFEQHTLECAAHGSRISHVVADV